MLKEQKINVGFLPRIIFLYNFSSVILKYNNMLHFEMYSLILASGCQAVFIIKIVNMLSPPPSLLGALGNSASLYACLQHHSLIFITLVCILYQLVYNIIL